MTNMFQRIRDWFTGFFDGCIRLLGTLGLIAIVGLAIFAAVQHSRGEDILAFLKPSGSVSVQAPPSGVTETKVKVNGKDVLILRDPGASENLRVELLGDATVKVGRVVDLSNNGQFAIPPEGRLGTNGSATTPGETIVIASNTAEVTITVWNNYVQVSVRESDVEIVVTSPALFLVNLGMEGESAKIEDFDAINRGGVFYVTPNLNGPDVDSFQYSRPGTNLGEPR